MRIQKIRDGSLSNSLPFGKELRSAARAMLNDFVPLQDCGFQDGGCLMFATALRDWSGDVLELAAVYRADRPGRAQHVVARFGEGLFLDSDGAATEADLLAKMNRLEGLPDPYVGEWSTAANQEEIPFDASAVDMLRLRLEQHLGRFDVTRLLPFEQAPPPAVGYPGPR